MDVIFETLESQGRTQRWLARQLGIHWTHLTHYKNGSRKAPEAIIRRSAELLGLPESLVLPVPAVGSPERETADAA